MTLRPHLFLIALAALCVLAPPAPAQLELPDKPVPLRGARPKPAKPAVPGSGLDLPPGTRPAPAEATPAAPAGQPAGISVV